MRAAHGWVPRAVWLRAALVVWLPALGALPADARPDPPARSYYVYVCAESEDEVALVRYGPRGLEVVRRVAVGRYPAETEGPHGIAVDPDGRHWDVSIPHGTPLGSGAKQATGSGAGGGG
ncbi:MAG: YncE family protein, partial [Acidobacteria bacterium]|nr:YncE family protein [Acidobacteriota bacterium]